MEKIALITGATKGIGRALADIFAREGYSLLLVARHETELATVQTRLKSEYACEVKTFAVDLSDPEGVDALINAFEKEIPKLDVLVNNAGFASGKKLADMTPEEVRGMIGLNISALTTLTHKILPHMVARKSGKILNVASTAAYVPGPYISIYFASKAYVLSFTEAISYEYRNTGVTISVLCPGPTRTNFFKYAGLEHARLLKLTYVMTAEKVAEIGYKNLMRGRRVIIAGITNKIMRRLVWLMPNYLVIRLIAFLNSSNR